MAYERRARGALDRRLRRELAEHGQALRRRSVRRGVALRLTLGYMDTLSVATEGMVTDSGDGYEAVAAATIGHVTEAW